MKSQRRHIQNLFKPLRRSVFAETVNSLNSIFFQLFWSLSGFFFLVFPIEGYKLPLVFKGIWKWNIFNSGSEFRSTFRILSNIQDQFVIFNPWKALWNWIVFYQNSFVISPSCYISWLDATLDDLQTRPLRQILLFLRNKSLTV